jgi:hypothetical protein
MEKMSSMDYQEIDYAMESVFDTAMEAAEAKGHVIDPKVRDALPDRAFGIVFNDAEGKTQRKYPLVVKNDPEVTKELVSKSIQFFHFAKSEWKAQLAKKILQVIKEEKLSITINKKSQLFKYINERDLPNTVKIIDTAKK